MIVEGLALAAAVAFSAQSSTTPAEIPSSVEQQQTLVEMTARGILPDGAKSWKEEDKVLLDRIRQAQAWGAIDLLKAQAGSLQGYAVWRHDGADRYLWLTKTGYEKYLFFRSQQARQYFEEQGTDIKFVFRLKSVNGDKLFSSKGILTAAGEELYNRIILGQKVQWIDVSGEITDNGPFRPVQDKK